MIDLRLVRAVLTIELATFPDEVRKGLTREESHGRSLTEMLLVNRVMDALEELEGEKAR